MRFGLAFRDKTSDAAARSEFEAVEQRRHEHVSETLRPEVAIAAPLVSIVVNNYNYARFLPRSIGSALAQTYPLVEVVVVDDASTDGSQEIIQAYGQRVTPVLRAVNGGQGAALNSSFAASRGEIVIFLDADDCLYPRAVETVIRQFSPGVSRSAVPARHRRRRRADRGHVPRARSSV